MCSSASVPSRHGIDLIARLLQKARHEHARHRDRPRPAKWQSRFRPRVISVTGFGSAAIVSSATRLLTSPQVIGAAQCDLIGSRINVAARSLAANCAPGHQGFTYGDAYHDLKDAKPLTTDTSARCRMLTATRPKATKPGLRALDACGDGFWEFDLIDGSAWFSDWFYDKLDWADASEAHDLERSASRCCAPALGIELMGMHPRSSGARRRRSTSSSRSSARQRASSAGACAARRSATARGQPVYLAGSMRDVSDEPDARERARRRACAAPSMHCRSRRRSSIARATLLAGQSARGENFPAATATQAIARLRAANSQTAIEFWLDER